MIEANTISGVGAIHRFVHDLEAERDLFCQQLDFAERGASSASLDALTHERSLVFQAGDCVVVCTTPLREDSMSARYLACHPEGVGAVTLAVPDLNQAFERLEQAGGNPVDDIRWFADHHGAVGRFSIATPLDDVQFHFVARKGPGLPLPGIDWYTSPRGGQNTLRFQRFDHITLNFRTMAPALLWLEHVLGFRRYWEVQLHTGEGAFMGATGSGLRSVVMWDPRSGIKFACNEPVRPNFSASQINSFCDSNRGSGIQHVALLTDDIVTAVAKMHGRGARFMRTSSRYYERLRERLGGLELLDTLQRHEILIDGSGPDDHLLQIFLEDAARVTGIPERGPFFIELIERRGNQGFGEGNFRALFDSIEQMERPQGS